MSNTGSKYHKIIIGIDKKESVVADIYGVIRAFDIKEPSLQHAIKKIAMPGMRGKGSEADDLIEAIDCVLEGAHEAVIAHGVSGPPPKNLQRFRTVLSSQKAIDTLAEIRSKLYSEGAGTHAAKIELIDSVLKFVDMDDLI